QIIDMSSLNNLINLTSLSVSHNKINNLNSIKSLHKLCCLDVSFNKITDFGSFEEFKHINLLYIQGNPISGLISPTDLIDKYKKFLSAPLNRQKAIEAVQLIYINVGLKAPKVIITDNYKSFYTETINLLKSNNKNHHDKESYINQKIDEKAEIRYKLYNRGLNFLYKDNSPIKKTVTRELIQEKFNKSELIQQIHSISQTIQFHLASKLLCESSLGKYSQACICLNNITPEHILHQIYLIETYQSLLKITLDEKTQKWYDCLNQLLEHCGWFIPFEDVCIVCDRPNKFSLDSETRLHAEGEPAIQFADGYGLYYHHGVALPEQYGKIHVNQWETKWLLSENNSELRRILIQAIGYNRICDELKAIKLDSFREYDLIKIDADADVEPIVLLKMICPSTGYTHVLRVPPHMESAREAITWINWGVDPEDFAVES
ncbi:MAG: leucine-rich repeat domain-containing protein, partial [Cyanobacteriota bacterium]|nr:leucine-rich repeat domain-containing protein [Cyanobacteriota bacterium]